MGQSSDSHRIDIRQSSDSHQIVIGQSSDSHQIFIRQSSDSHRIVIGQSSDSHRIVIEQSSVVIGSHRQSLVVICSHWQSLVVIGSHSQSLRKGRLHSYICGLGWVGWLSQVVGSLRAPLMLIIDTQYHCNAVLVVANSLIQCQSAYFSVYCDFCAVAAEKQE